jgi:hypothetical protein
MHMWRRTPCAPPLSTLDSCDSPRKRQMPPGAISSPWGSLTGAYLIGRDTAELHSAHFPQKTFASRIRLQQRCRPGANHGGNFT